MVTVALPQRYFIFYCLLKALAQDISSANNIWYRSEQIPRSVFFFSISFCSDHFQIQPPTYLRKAGTRASSMVYWRSMRLVRTISVLLLSGHHPLPVLISLTVYKRVKFYRLENSPVAVTVFRDGVIYLICMSREYLTFNEFLSGTGPYLRSSLDGKLHCHCRSSCK
jgi:hypothetical protein